MKRITGLDLFRFIVAIGIMSYHYYFIGPLQNFYSFNIFHPIAFFGEFGVDIFFIISGFVILFSTTKVKEPLTFLKKRALRIYPAFIICSLFTLICGFIMPGVSKIDLLFRWINSLTFYEDLWNVSPLSAIYWTLMIEIKFYILVAIILKLKLWDKHKYKILLAWLVLSFLNIYIFKNNYIDILFLTKYSGHFIFGIILYLIYKDKKELKNIKLIGLSLLSLFLIYKNMISYTTWIRGIYKGYVPSNLIIFIYMIVIIGIMYYIINYYKDILPQKFVSTLGGMSFIIYLIHADFGFFLKTQYFIRLSNYIQISEPIIMIFSMIISITLSYIILQLVNIITKYIKLKYKL